MSKDFLVFQLLIGLLVAYVVLLNTPLKIALIGDGSGLPEWIAIKNPKVVFI